MQRTLVSYDDIVPGPPAPAPAWNTPPAPIGPSSNGPPPRKKQRKQRQQQRRNQNQHQHQYQNQNGAQHFHLQQQHQHQQQSYHHHPAPSHLHWDDPAAAEQPMPYDASMDVTPAPEEEEEEDEGEGEMSRMLTHEEIWDDSALIDAWESATAEYEAFHGKGKSWKNAPVKKSPLWYNVPPAAPSKEPAKPATNGDADAENSQPLDFATFVPMHEAALPAPAAGHMQMPAFDFNHGTPEAWTSRDEAFSHAMGAMYWAGYWTAVYHSHGKATAKMQGKRKRSAEEEEEEEEVQEEGEHEEAFDEAEAEGANAMQSAPANCSATTLSYADGGEEFVPTQR